VYSDNYIRNDLDIDLMLVQLNSASLFNHGLLVFGTL